MKLRDFFPGFQFHSAVPLLDQAPAKKPAPVDYHLTPSQEMRMRLLAYELMCDTTGVDAATEKLRAFAREHFDEGCAHNALEERNKNQAQIVEPWDEPKQ